MPEKMPTILVADDQESNRYVLSKILKRYGYDVIEARTGIEALEKSTDLPEIVVLDVNFPDILGYEVCRRIKANPLTSRIPVLQISASFVTDESKVQALESGADAYLTQPIEPPVLVATIRALLRMQRAEALSSLSANQWQSTFDSLSEGIGLIDSNLLITRCNRAMTHLLGKTFGEIEKSSFLAILRDRFGILDYQVEATGRQTFESQVEDHWYHVTVDPIRTTDDVGKHQILVIADVSDRKRAEEALRLSERLAATGRLAHIIAHEMNNPLEAVVNLLYLAKASLDKPETAKSYLEQLDSELQRVMKITKQTLSFHRDSTSPVSLDVRDLLDDVIHMHRIRVVAGQIEIAKRYEDVDPIEAFPGELRQVFSNFISNALDALEGHGRITVHVFPSCFHGKGAPRQGVRVAICDNGRGIPREIRKRIFDAFFTTKQQKGSGLGLWLSLSTIHKHGGHIAVRSSVAPGRSGTVFSIFLPFSNTQEAIAS